MELHWQCAREHWQAIVDRAERATVFHTPAWTELTCATTGWVARPLRVSWPDGREAVVPILGFSLWGGLVPAVSVGVDGYGGILATGPVSDADQQTIYRAIRRRYRTCWMNSNPFDGELPTGVGHTWEAVPPTRALRLAPLDDLRRRYHKERLRCVRRYQADQVRVTWQPRLGAEEQALVTRLYAVECERWRSEGRPTDSLRSPAWFEQLWQHCRDRLSLAVATVDGEVAGVELLIRQGRIATELLMVWDRRFAAQQVSTALAETCFAAAYEAGCEWVDSMPSGTLTGVDRYKASFGAEALPIGGYHQASPLHRVLLATQKLRTMGWRKTRHVPDPQSREGTLVSLPS